MQDMAAYKPSYYADTRQESLLPDLLEPEQHVDVCLIGGGIAALSCAQSLIEAGRSVTLLEANKLFSGASGLNGGFVSPGYALSNSAIEKQVGLEVTQALFDLTVAGVKKVAANIKALDISSAGRTAGKISLLRHLPSADERRHAEQMQEKFNYALAAVDRPWLLDNLSSTAYQYGYLDENAFHMQPLNYGLAVANALQQKGLRIIEGDPVQAVKAQGGRYRISSASGHTYADQVVICTGGYASGENSKIKRSVLPITTYVAVTEPDDTLPARHIRIPYALGDTRRASDYYRLVNQNQLLWGGRITAFPTKNVDKIKDYIKNDILKSYPDMQNLRIKTAWSGIMGYATHKMPYIGRLGNGIWYCTAFGGRGLGAGTAGGTVVADALLGNNRAIDLFRAFPLCNAFGAVGRVGVEATYKKYIIGDHIREYRHTKR